MRRLRRTAALRDLVRETELSPARLVAPLFVASLEEPIDSMPGVSRLTISGAVAEAGRRELRLAHEIAERCGAPQPPHARLREGRHPHRW